MALETQSTVLKKGAEPVKPAKKSSVVRKFLRKLYVIVSSPIGLIILLILYSFVGAALFQVSVVLTRTWPLAKL